jgi:hypothetical protein
VGLAVVPASNARDFNFISGTNAKLDDPAGGSSEIYRSSATGASLRGPSLPGCA